MNDQIQVITIPRGISGNELTFCIVFGLTETGQAEAFRDWPSQVEKLFTGASIEFGDKSVQFQRIMPKDLMASGWTTDRASQTWNMMFGRYFQAPIGFKAQPDVRHPFQDIYSQNMGASRDVLINPDSASDLNPANRFESPNTRAIGDGLMAKQVIQLRDNADEVTRIEIDDRLIAAMDPEDFHQAVAMLDADIAAWPYRYSAEVREIWQDVAAKLNPFQVTTASIWAGMSAEHRALVKRELVNHRLLENTKNENLEIQRVGRIIDSNSNLQDMDKSKVTEELNFPSFRTLLGRVRQYPGLARRLFLVVHGKVNLPENLPEEGSVKIIFAENEKKFTSLQTEYILRVGANHKFSFFRPKIHVSEQFSPSEDQFYAHHLFDTKLYTVTQQDFLIAAARQATLGVQDTATNTAKRDSSESKALAESTFNSVQFLWKPRVKGPAAASVVKTPADAVDQRLQESAKLIGGKTPPMLHAEDLMVGWSVFVRRIHRDSGPWRMAITVSQVY